MSISQSAVAPLTHLPKQDPEIARLGNAVLRLLANDRAANQAIDISLVSDQRGARYFHVDDHIAFAVNSSAVAGDHNDGKDIDIICSALDNADILLSHAEGALGLKLDPSAVHDNLPDDFTDNGHLCVRLAQGVDEMLLYLSADSRHSPAWIEKAGGAAAALSYIPLAIGVECSAARLSIDAAAAIGPGDLLLLPQQMTARLWAASLNAENMGVYYPKSGEFLAAVMNQNEEDMSMDNQEDAGGGSAMMTVPVSLRLPQQQVDAASLSALRSGAVLPLGPLVQGLHVDLLVGGRVIARGEIVELGENFAVHIDERAISSGQTTAPDTILEEAE